jgi:hypothetical protein
LAPPQLAPAQAQALDEENPSSAGKGTGRAVWTFCRASWFLLCFSSGFVGPRAEKDLDANGNILKGESGGARIKKIRSVRDGRFFFLL